MIDFGTYGRFIIIGAVIVLVIIFGIVRSRMTHFVCSSCGAHFQANVFKYLFTTHSLGKRYVKCPKCGKRDYLTPKIGKE